MNLTREEGRRLADLAKSKPGPEKISAYWSKVLLDRATLFQGVGLKGLPSYEMGAQPVSPAVHLQALVSERKSIAREFAPLLRECGLIGSEPNAARDPFHYWALYEVSRHATLTSSLNTSV